MTEDDAPVTRKVLKKDLDDLESRIDKKLDNLGEKMSEQMQDIETALLRAFQNYAKV